MLRPRLTQPPRRRRALPALPRHRRRSRRLRRLPRRGKGGSPLKKVEPILKVRKLLVRFDSVCALKEASCDFKAGTLTAVLGANGSGKTTLLKAIAGLVPVTSGKIFYLGENVTRLPPHERVRMGIQYIPDRARVGLSMTVEENLLVGAYLRKRKEALRDLERVYDLFPDLARHRKDLAGVLSGGQRQMLVVGRALLSSPRVMLFDEPFLGLSLSMREKIVSLLRELKGEGLTLVVAEHDLDEILPEADEYLVFLNGEVVMSGRGGPGEVEKLKRRFRQYYGSGRSCGNEG
ncbi:MAG: ABC transporter ATP-binding protein [Deltaproteobacteria bacterium]|nr:MAG: ABC transporter ATP-binding protein [Deltaproteobacteria bacterium]